jgi:hypothetical protein
MTIVHALEKMDGYESRLIASMERRPSSLAARMINRLLNAGTRTVGKVHLIELMQKAAEGDDTSHGVRGEILDFLAYQGVQVVAKPAAKPTGAVPNMEAFLPFLNVSADDPTLAGFVTMLGYKLKAQEEDGRANFCMPTIGVELMFSKAKSGAEDLLRLTSIAFNAEGYERYAGYPGKMLRELSFDLDRNQARRLLGDPQKSGGGNLLGKTRMPEWDRWTQSAYWVMVFYFAATGKIGSVRIRQPG